MKKRALLIGMNKYKKCHTLDACELPCTLNDVRILGKKLIQLDFETSNFIDISIDEMKCVVKKFAMEAPCDSLNIIYFSGHGGHYKGNNFVYPIDFGTNLDKLRTVEESAYDIQEFAKAFEREVKLVLIVDACRSNLTSGYNGKYSEMVVRKNTYIAYSTQFNEPSICNSQISHFTEMLSENILTPNISVDELFNNVRASLFLKYSKQISNSVSAFMEYVTLNSQVEKDDIASIVLEFVDKFGDMYIEKYGCFAGDDLVFIDAAQYCGISVLDAIYKFMVMDRKRCNLTTSLTEAHEKLISFWGMLNTGLKQDEYYTWQYHGRPVRLGEIPSLPIDMQKPVPDSESVIEVTLSVSKEDNCLKISTNLPDFFQFYGQINGEYNFNDVIVKDGKAIIPLSNEDIKPQTIDIYSVSINVMKVDKKIVGDRCRNLIGKYVKFNPIHGNMVEFHDEISVKQIN